jgi:hypothetical protein
MAERLTGRHMDIPAVWYEQPIYYKANRVSVVGLDADVRWPAYAELLDYELELACVIGRGGVDIPAEQAAAHVFGFTIFNDISARDAQATEMEGQLGPAKGKDFDTGNVLGPWLVTADEVGDPYDLTMVARVNGEEWSRGHSGTMHHRFEDIIAFVSQSETLIPARSSARAPPGRPSRTITDRRRCRYIPTYCRSTGPPLLDVLVERPRVLARSDDPEAGRTFFFVPAPIIAPLRCHHRPAGGRTPPRHPLIASSLCRATVGS